MRSSQRRSEEKPNKLKHCQITIILRFILWLDGLKYNLDTNKTQLTTERNVQVWWSISAGSCHPRPCAAAWCPEGGWRSGERSWTPAYRSVFASWTSSSTAGPSCQSGTFPGSGSAGPREKRTEASVRVVQLIWGLRCLCSVLLPSGAPRWPWSQETSCGVPSSPASRGFLWKKTKMREGRDQLFNNNKKRETKLLKLNAKNSWE